MKTPKIIQKVQEYHSAHGREKTLYRLQIGEYALESLLHFSEKSILNTGILRSLYGFFEMELDDFYYSHFQNLPQIKRHEGIVGNIFRAKRIRRGLTIHEVARRLRVDEKTIDRLERGAQLPTTTSYTITKLQELYEMSNEEKENINALIISIHHAIKIFKKELQNF